MASFDAARKVDIEEQKPESADHQCVTKFGELMKQELDANQPRKHGREGWLKNDPVDHVLQVYYHNGKLQVALKTLETLKRNKDASRHEIQFYEAQVKEYAADVGNHAMMVIDSLRLLGVPVEEPKVEIKEVYRDFS